MPPYNVIWCRKCLRFLLLRPWRIDSTIQTKNTVKVAEQRIFHSSRGVRCLSEVHREAQRNRQPSLTESFNVGWQWLRAIKGETSAPFKNHAYHETGLDYICGMQRLDCCTGIRVNTQMRNFWVKGCKILADEPNAGVEQLFNFRYCCIKEGNDLVPFCFYSVFSTYRVVWKLSCQVPGMVGWNVAPQCIFGVGSSIFWEFSQNLADVFLHNSIYWS